VERLDTFLLEVAQRLALERYERASYLLARLGFGTGTYDGVRALRIPACRDQRLRCQFLACQQAAHSLHLRCKVESADLEVAVEGGLTLSISGGA
jgi:hypothetical protein